MCTLLLAARVVPDHPLVVVANRDEQLDRASAPPSWWSDARSHAQWFAPRDLVGGGTWLGLNEHGLFVAITNRFLGPRDAARVSRGSLVVDALSCRSAKEVHARMGELDPARYNGFHLVYADGEDVLVTVGDGTSLAQATLGDGLAIVTERSFGAAEAYARKRRIENAWTSLSAPPFDAARLTKLLTEHDTGDVLAATCIHVPELRYGTRSSFVLATNADGSTPTAYFADGPPCTTAFSRLSLRRP
jgi:uncharacterized protein with NRDE domain